MLSIVDNRTFKRLGYKVLEKSPTQEEVHGFLENFKAKLDERGLSLKAITTDGSPLYPKPIAAIFPDVKHQICRFHVLADITKAVLAAVAQVRKELKAKIPKRRRGRPGKRHRKQARRIERARKRITELFEHRHLFVKKHLSDRELELLEKITRGLPQLRVLRTIMNTVYDLFDRRCRTPRARAKLAELRRRVRRFAKLRQSLAALFSANLDKALLFLDDKLLPSTSNAVERTNRRHRKMQKSVYSVRTIGQVRGRIALDMQRDQQRAARQTTMHTLHIDRSNPSRPLRETG